MAIKDRSQRPLSPKQLLPFSPEDEKKAQKELARLRRNKKSGFEGKTLWDWLQLLGVPLLLAFATIGFGFVQFYLADQQHTADQRSALDQQQATILQTYIDNIQELMLKDNLFGNNPAPKNDADLTTILNVQELARARTLTALQGLDPGRKGRLVQFLYEAQLIGFTDDAMGGAFKLQSPIISLRGADLSGANLNGVVLNGVDFSSVDLSQADLSQADLSRAEFSVANLMGTNLSGADLKGVDLSFANLSLADLTQQQLDQASSCTGATLPTGLLCHKNP